MSELSVNNVFDKVSALLNDGKTKVVAAINSTMVNTYFEIGRAIYEEEQQGNSRAEYGQRLLKNLSLRLSTEFGKGFSVENLDRMRFFYKVYSGRNSSTALTNFNLVTDRGNFSLSWSHYLKLMRIENEPERKFYEIESARNNWSVRELQRQFDAALYTRLSLSRDKQQISELSKNGLLIEKPKDAIKDPYVLEFIGLPDKEVYSESDLESELINKIEEFLLELGTGFAFVARQKRITFDERHFRVDLVFYNRILRCFVLIDLKIGELKHQDIGQMQMYVNYFDREIKLEDEGKTIGLILCRDKSESIVKYTLPENNEHIFASKYLTVLPNKEDLEQLIGNTNV